MKGEGRYALKTKPHYESVIICILALIFEMRVFHLRYLKVKNRLTKR